MNKRKWAPLLGESAKQEQEDVPKRAKTANVVDVDGGDEDDEEAAHDVDVDDAGDDEEGRFFGGGLSDEQRQILDIMNRDAGNGVADDAPRDDVAEARTLFAQLERAIDTNQAMRLKYSNDPHRFIDSEADLDAAIRACAVLSTNARTLYPMFVKHGMPAVFVGLLSHDNADIAAAAIEVLAELVDDSDASAEEASAFAALKEALQASQLGELLVSNLTRFQDTVPDGAEATEHYDNDAKAVYHILSVLEHVRSDVDALFPWLLERTMRRGRVDQNQAYAAEVLAMYLADSEASRDAVARHGGIDVLLRAASRYMHTTPADADEREFFQNIIDALQFMLLAPEHRAVFVECEGVELMLRLLKRKRRVRQGALTVLCAATQHGAGAAACERVVEAGGLASIGALLERPVRGADALNKESMTPLLGMLQAMLYNLASDEAPRLRLLTKLAQPSKMHAVLAWRDLAHEPLDALTPALEKLRAAYAHEGVPPADIHAAVLAEKVDTGWWDILERCDHIIAWLMMEDDHAQAELRAALGPKLAGVIAELDESLVHYEAENVAAAGGESLAEVTRALADYLRSLA